MSYVKWEIWFVLSMISLISMLFIGTLPGSVQAFPNYLYGLALVVINFIVCIAYGNKTKS